MDNDELKLILESKISKAIGYEGSSLSIERGQAMDYYLGEPLGNEVEGRSQVVSTDVADTIEAIMPELMRIFESGGNTVEFEPEGEEDVHQAELASEYVNFIWQRDNSSFINTYTWIKDGLLQKTGIIKIYWDETEEKIKKTLNGLSEDELVYVMQNEELEIVGHTENIVQPETMDEIYGIIPAVTSHDIQVETTKKKGRVKVVPVPPEEFLIDSNARSLDDASFISHRVRRTISELREEGYDEKILATIPSYDEEIDFSSEAVARRANDTDYLLSSETDIDESAREVWVNETYLYVDFNGDGKTEYRKIVSGGDGYEILDNEEIEFHPFCGWSPILMPHRFTGRSIAELVMDIQEIKTTMWRQYLDNLYASNNQRHVVNENVNLSDLLVSRPNGIVRTKGIPGQDVVALPVAQLGQSILAGMEYVDTIKSDRTGVTDATAGMNPNVLANANTGVMAAFVEKSQSRIELMARVFAEVGLKQAHKLILKYVIKYQDTERMVRFNDEWKSVNPAEWSPSMDLKVNVGLGRGNKEQKQSNMLRIGEVQREGLAIGITTPEMIYNAVVDGVDAMGESTSKYFQNPKNAQPQQPKPDQAEMLVKAEMDKKQLDIKQKHEEMIVDAYIELQKLALEYDVPMQSLEGYAMLQQAEAMEHQQEQAAMMQQQQPMPQQQP